MFLKIDKEKVKVGLPILNGEPVLVSIQSIEETTIEEVVDETTVSSKALNIEFYVMVESLYNASGENDKFNFIQTPSRFTLKTDSKPYEVIAMKLLKDKLVEVLGLTDDDITIIGRALWEEDPAIRNIRVTIPKNEVVENFNYNGLVSGLISNGIPFYSDTNNYYIYLEEIYPEHSALLEADENVLIEE